MVTNSNVFLKKLNKRWYTAIEEKKFLDPKGWDKNDKV